MAQAEPIIFFAETGVRLPQQSKLLQAGKDIFLVDDLILLPREKKKVTCKVGAIVPQGHFGLIVPRSSTHSLWITIHLGVLDGYYVDEIKLSFTNDCFTTQYFFNKGTALAQIIFIPYHLGPSVLAHPQQLQFQNEQGKFPSGSSGNSEQVQSVQVKSQFRDKYPKAECPLCGHSPAVDPSHYGSTRQDDRSTTQILIDLLERLRIAESSNLQLPEVGCDKSEA